MIIHRSTEKEFFFFKRTRVTTCLMYLILCILAIQNPSVKKRNKANRVIWVILNSKNNTKTYSSLGSRPISSYDCCYYIYCRHFVFRMQYEAVSQRIFKQKYMKYSMQYSTITRQTLLLSLSWWSLNYDYF